MKLSLEGLQILDAISRCGSFAAAAEELFRVPSTITYAVQKLEEDLGVPIFQRNGHRPRLTPAGEALLREGRLIVQATTDLEERVKRIAEGFEAQLAIALDGLLPCAPLLQLMRAFYADEAHAQTDVRITHEALATSLDSSAARKADLAIVALSESALREGKHHTRLIGTLDIVLAVNPQHPLAAQRGPVPKEALRKHRIALNASAPRRVPRQSADLLVGQKTITLPTLHARITALKDGFAAGFLPRAVVARELASGELIEVRLDRPPAPASFYLAWDDRPKGNAFQWWFKHLDRPTLVDEWLNPAPAPARRPVLSQVVPKRA
jgi:DNA-binding transcriptional LysR family regulator